VTQILRVSTNRLVRVEIVAADTVKMPLKKDGWNFNWAELAKDRQSKTYVLRTIEAPKSVEGVLQLRVLEDMLIMDLIEIAPHNVGQTNKRFDDVGACLIAFACRESFKMKGPYKGYLSFVSKTSLIEWYRVKYGAEQAIGQKMFIAPEKGSELIERYLSDEDPIKK